MVIYSLNSKPHYEVVATYYTPIARKLFELSQISIHVQVDLIGHIPESSATL